VNRRFLAGMQGDAISGQITYLASSFQTDHVHLRGDWFEDHRYFGADDAGNSDGSANAKMRVGLDQRGSLGTDSTII
jgi:hypothetical protein